MAAKPVNHTLCSRPRRQGMHQRYRYTVYAHGATVCAPLIHDLRAWRLPAQLAHMPHAARCGLLAPAKPARQYTRRGLCAKPAATHRTLYTAARPLVNACLCEALGRQAGIGSFDFCTFLLKDNTAGLATALRGEQATGPAPAYTGGTCTAGRRSSSRVGRRGSRRRPCSPPVLNLVQAAVGSAQTLHASTGPRAASTGPRCFDWRQRG